MGVGGKPASQSHTNRLGFPFQIPQENTDAIVTKAIDLWHKYCGTPMHSV